MKEKCIIHIGMPKTGSTSIQNTLHRKLVDKKFDYMKIGTSSPNHSGTIISFCENKLPQSQSRGLTRDKIIEIDKKNRKNFIEYIINNNSPVSIISGEEIHQVSINGLEYLKNFLKKYFKQVVVVGYIRSPKSFMDSSLQQRVKGGLDTFDVEILYPYYRRRFEKFDEAFGRENVKFWKFDPKSFPKGNIVLDFCQKLGIEMQAEQTVRVNESLSKEALSLLYTYRKYGIDHGLGENINKEYYIYRLIGEIMGIGDTKVRLSPSITNPILEKYNEDTRWMEERLGESLSENIVEIENDIVSESDLLENNEYTISKLIKLIGINYLKESKYDYAELEVGELMHILRMKLIYSNDSKC